MKSHVFGVVQARRLSTSSTSRMSARDVGEREVDGTELEAGLNGDVGIA